MLHGLIASSRLEVYQVGRSYAKHTGGSARTSRSGIWVFGRVHIQQQYSRFLGGGRLWCTGNVRRILALTQQIEVHFAYFYKYLVSYSSKVVNGQLISAQLVFCLPSRCNAGLDKPLVGALDLGRKR